MVAAAASDVARRRIPNWLNVSILAAGLAARFVLGAWTALGWGAAGAALGLALLFFLWQAGWISGGDVKLAAAMGAWLGPVNVFWAVLFGLAAGGLVSAAVALLGGRALRAEVAANMKAAVYTLSTPHAPQRERRHRVPQAVALAAAAVGVVIVRGGLHV